MSEFFPCWILKPDLFFSFFKKYPAARKLLAAALTGFPPKRLVSVLWYPGSLYEGGFCLQVRPDNRASFILELVPVFSGQLPFAVSESPPENASFTVPRGNFLQVFLTFQEANQQNPFFYGNFDASSLPFPAVSSIFLPSSPLFLPFRISMPFPVSFWSAIPPNCLPSPGVFPPSLLSRRSWKKFSGNRSYEPYLQKHLIFPRKLPAESLPCVPSTGCCSAKNASMNSRRSPMIRKLCEIYSGSFGQRDFSHTKRTRAAYTGPKKREKSIYEKASLLY